MFKIFLLITYSTGLFAGRFFEAKEKVLFEEHSTIKMGKWLEKDDTKEENIKFLLSNLSKSLVGEKILLLATKKAQDLGQTLIDIIDSGDHSFTDTTLIRRFNQSLNSPVIYESRSKIYIDKDLGIKDGILDLAHELTHYALKKNINPYKSDFLVEDFIKSTIEGKGGEVDAFMVECAVYRDLYPTSDFLNSNCGKLIDSTSGKLLRVKGIKEFYKIGDYFDKFMMELKKYGLAFEKLPYLNQNEAIFFSSAYGLPYPMAALIEFVRIKAKVCKNKKNRLSMLKNDFPTYLKDDFVLHCQKFYSIN